MGIDNRHLSAQSLERGDAKNNKPTIDCPVSGRRGMPGGPGPVGPPGYCQFCEALKMQANAGSQKKG